MLKSIGLTKAFAQFVLMVAHSSGSDNNPYQSSLNCGACGGNDGIPNTIVICQALNNLNVRKLLAERFEIMIPNDTFFVSSCHNTTTDQLTFFNLDNLPSTATKQFKQIENDCLMAGELLRKERLSSLPGNNSINSRTSNWAELVPELGLANNAAFIVGPRALTQGINLDRRTFLHSYEPSEDQDGSILTFILSAPVLVGHLINSQYYFSTTDQGLFASGNKAIHNITGGFGVMEGNFSDHKIGLPTQSIEYHGKKLHQPLRLLLIVYATKKFVESALMKSPQINALVKGNWIHLKVIEPST